MRNMKTNQIAIFLFLIFFPVAGALGAYFAITELTAEEIKIPSEPGTHFYVNYVKNENEMIADKPAVYRVMLENREGLKVDYGLKVLLDGKEIHNQQIILQNNDISNETVSVIPDMKGDYQKLEFMLSKGSEPFRTYVFQIIPSTGYGKIYPPSIQKKEIIDKKVEYPLVENESNESSNYIVEMNGSNIIYKFKSGERLEMAIRDGVVNIGDAVYSTVSDGNSIVFIQDMYEKIYPNSLTFLYPIILSAQNNKLSINETLKFKNGYSVILREIDSRNINREILKIDISKDSKIVREVISNGNSPIEYWHLIDDYKKERIMRIIPTSISSNEITFDITQYGNKKQFLIGNRYEEFQIETITQDSIVMKNTQPLNLETGKVLSLIKGKIQIKV